MDHIVLRSKRNLILIFLMVAMALLVAACGGSGDTASTSDTSEPTLPPAEAADIISEAPDASELYANITENTTDGETLYNTFCSKCHGMSGAGDGPSMGSLHPMGNIVLTLAQDKSDEELMATITLGKGVDMPPWGLILTLEQREAVLAYIRSLG